MSKMSTKKTHISDYFKASKPLSHGAAAKRMKLSDPSEQTSFKLLKKKELSLSKQQSKTSELKNVSLIKSAEHIPIKSENIPIIKSENDSVANPTEIIKPTGKTAENVSATMSADISIGNSTESAPIVKAENIPVAQSKENAPFRAAENIPVDKSENSAPSKSGADVSLVKSTISAVSSSSSTRNVVPFPNLSQKTSILSSRKQLEQNEDPDALKKSIRKYSNIKELQSCLLRLNDCSKKLHDFRKKNFCEIQKSPPESPSKKPPLISPQKCRPLQSPGKNSLLLQSPRKILLENASLSPKKSDGSPLKTSASPLKIGIPLFQRYEALTLLPLALPYQYKLVEEYFRCTETIVSLMYNRKEAITFAKLQMAVKTMLRRSFNLDNLAQIKTVFPEAYRYEYVKRTSASSDVGDHNSRYQLTISPVLETAENSSDVSEVPDNVMQLFLPSCITERKYQFHEKLVNILKDHHQTFLRSLGTPIEVDNDKITSWHVSFDLDEVPDIEKAQFPHPPDVDKINSAKELLEKSKHFFKKVQQPQTQDLETNNNETQCANINSNESIPISKNPETLKSLEKSIMKPEKIAKISKALKGISASLIEKIRSKEAAKLKAELTRHPESMKRLKMLDNLPEVVRILQNVFTVEKKSALLLELISQKVVDSHRTLQNTGDVKEHLTALVKISPNWISMITLRGVDYVRINKNTELAQVMQKIEDARKEC